MSNPTINFSIKRNGVEIPLTADECWEAYEKIKEVRFYDYSKGRIEEVLQENEAEIDDKDFDESIREMSLYICDGLADNDTAWDVADMFANEYLDKFKTRFSLEN